MKLFKHFITITKHRWIVRKICFKIGRYWQGLTHDLSKYSWVEFVIGAKYYLGTKSPTIAEREDKGYSAAWMHHKGRNKHHFEYWFDANEKGIYVPIKMPIKYLKEMFADRVAASKVYKGKDYSEDYPLEYLLTHRGKEMLHPESFEKLKEWLSLLKDKGEKETCKIIRKEKDY